MKFVDTRYFKNDGENIIFTGPYMEIYVPGDYFKKELAEQVGDNFKIFGLVNLVTFNDAEAKSPNPMRLLNAPIKFMTYPSAYEVRKMDLKGSDGPEPVVVLKYNCNDVLCPALMPKTSLTFRDFLAILTGGKIPGFTPYDEVFNIWMENMDMAGISFDIPDSNYEIAISEIYRSKQNPLKKFGAVLAKDPKHDLTDYVTFSPREITKTNSTFTGIAFEDMDQMLTASINRAVKNKPERTSPMEEIIKY